MQVIPPALDRLIADLSRLPGIGRKTATRLGLYILRRPESEARQLAEDLARLHGAIRPCRFCCAFSETDPCAICADPARDATRLAVVETPADQAALERSGAFHGRYFVLMGRISPLDGAGVRDIGAHELMERACDGAVREVILATNFTAEGEATAHLLGEALRSRGLAVTRLARGVPAGSELEYVDLGTIAHALAARR